METGRSSRELAAMRLRLLVPTGLVGKGAGTAAIAMFSEAGRQDDGASSIFIFIFARSGHGSQPTSSTSFPRT